MRLDEYQRQAHTFAIYSRDNNTDFYPVLGLASEAGEVCGKVKKLIRDGKRDDLAYLPKEDKKDLVHELGGCLWYIAEIATVLDVALSHVAGSNLHQLAGRKARDTIKGSGDDR